MEQQTPSPQIKDDAAQRAKMHHFPILDLRGRGDLGFPFILSKIVGGPISVLGGGGSYTVWKEQFMVRKGKKTNVLTIPICYCCVLAHENP